MQRRQPYRRDQRLCLLSSETLSFFLPLALLLAITALPLAVAILERKPCLFLLFLCEGWKVLFITVRFLKAANILASYMKFKLYAC